MRHFLMNHLTSEEQVSDQGPRSLVKGFQLRPGKREANRTQNQLHINQLSTIGFGPLNSHSLSHPYLSSGPGLGVN